MVLIPIGRMDRRITLRRPVSTRGAAGGITRSFEDVATVWAEKLDLLGREYIAAQQVNAEINTRFRMRYRTDLKHTWRISLDEKDYDIVSIAEIGRRRWLEVLAKAAGSAET